MKKIFALAVFFATSIASAQPIKCNPDGNTDEQFQCAVQELAKADARHQAAYKRIIPCIPDKEVLKRLHRAELTWLRFRYSECSYKAAIFIGGSQEKILNTTCQSVMTNARAKQLEAEIQLNCQ